MPLSPFHPLVQRWFSERFREPTEPQRLGWPAIAAGKDTLIAAPTGSGKTLTAFLYNIDRLLRTALEGKLEDRTYVLYVSPLRALSNDIQRNLQGPLAELLELARQQDPRCPEIRALVRTGDTPPAERQRMVRKPPHILVTTPESFFLILTGARSREILRGVETVIVDEIHALARDKRGAHLALSLERLEALCERRPVRIGLSATQKPIEEIGRFLVGAANRAAPAAPQVRLGGAAGTPELPQIVDIGHARQLDLAVEVPASPLQAVCSHEQWGEIYERLVQLIQEHRSTLIFVNTRRWAERVARQLSDRLGEDAVASHHGSLAHRIRQSTEQRLKAGELKVVVATASLEMGIDIGHIDLVCQLGTPRSIATLLQRVGRAGHSLGVIPKGRLFALTRDELLECLALVRAVYARRLDRIDIPKAPIDILAQQIVAAVACDEWDEDQLFERFRRAHPFRELPREKYDEVLTMLSEGIASRRGRRSAFLHHDRVNRRLRARRGARLTAITCGGAIPEVADYRVVLDDENRTIIGSLNEDFAIESMAGDVFLLGNHSWQIQYVRAGDVVVKDARGAPPTIPFWLGEAPGRTMELSAEVGELREEIARRWATETERRRDGETERQREGETENQSNEQVGRDAVSPSPCLSVSPSLSETVDWLTRECHTDSHGAQQAIDYVAVQQAATGMVPTQKRVLFERFFDESGGMQLVVHAPFGTRITRAWGLALRKSFCRTFDFELQASAGDNGIVLSLGPQHSFPLEQMYHLVNTKSARDILIQAMLAVPFFTTRWRWNATRALAVKRMEAGRKVPPPLQRFRADDLLTAVFPQQTGCLENVVGDIEVPDHPLVQQTMDDCLYEASDLEGWLQVLRDLESGAIEVVGLDTREPSPFAHELLNANPYAFLDDAPLEERRARAVSLRRSMPIEAMKDLARLDPEAIARVRSEAWPLVRDADELHDTLLSLVALPVEEGREWKPWFEQLRATGRAGIAESAAGQSFWVTAERWPAVQAIWPKATSEPALTVPPGIRQEWEAEDAFVELVRGRLEVSGPITARDLAQRFGVDPRDILRALLALENQGFVLRGRFTNPTSQANTANEEDLDLEWCERRLLARIHRLTLEGLRRQIEAVPPEQFMRFLVRHQHVHPETQCRIPLPYALPLGGGEGLLTVIELLQGFEAPAGHWERFLLPARVADYDPASLDMLTYTGQVVWGRLRPPRRSEDRARPMKALTRSIPITLMLRRDLPWLLPSLRTNEASPEGQDALTGLGSNARAAVEMLNKHGALFIDQLAYILKVVPTQVEQILGELVAAGLVTCDGFAALRNIIDANRRKHRRIRMRRRPARGQRPPLHGGRWSLLANLAIDVDSNGAGPNRIESWCRLLLRRYGVVFRDLLERESAAPPWFELVRMYRTLEARGEVRGGRFVAQVAGEQFALAETISRLRQKNDDDTARCLLPATDPLNLFGRAGGGTKVPALPGNRIVIEGGRLVAHRIGVVTTGNWPEPPVNATNRSLHLQYRPQARGRQQD
jgi:ATP-dependent Lhr-like helicase